MENQQIKKVVDVERKKRVKRMKTFIILTVFTLLFLSIFLNFILLFRVLNLQDKINELYSITTIPITLCV